MASNDPAFTGGLRLLVVPLVLAYLIYSYVQRRLTYRVCQYYDPLHY